MRKKRDIQRQINKLAVQIEFDKKQLKYAKQANQAKRGIQFLEAIIKENETKVSTLNWVLSKTPTL